MLQLPLYLLVLGSIVSQVICFQPTSLVSVPRISGTTTLFSNNSGKGFGAPPPPPAPKKRKPDDDGTTESTPVARNNAAAAEPPLNAGQQALFEMRRQRAEQRDAELRKVKELREMDEALKEAPAAIPEKVASRMGQRMIAFVGVPLFLGLGSFVVFWYLATYKDLEFEPATVAFTTIAILAVSLLGITYSIFSTSWDEDRQDEGLGLSEAKKNLSSVKAGLGRSRDNAILREKMDLMPEREIDRALADLERRDASAGRGQEQNTE